MKQLNDAKVFITWHCSKTYGILTCETRLKVAVNMEDLTCLLETVHTLSTYMVPGDVNTVPQIIALCTFTFRIYGANSIEIVHFNSQFKQNYIQWPTLSSFSFFFFQFDKPIWAKMMYRILI